MNESQPPARFQEKPNHIHVLARFIVNFAKARNFRDHWNRKMFCRQNCWSEPRQKDLRKFWKKIKSVYDSYKFGFDNFRLSGFHFEELNKILDSRVGIYMYETLGWEHDWSTVVRSFGVIFRFECREKFNQIALFCASPSKKVSMQEPVSRRFLLTKNGRRKLSFGILMDSS